MGPQVLRARLRDYSPNPAIILWSTEVLFFSKKEEVGSLETRGREFILSYLGVSRRISTPWKIQTEIKLCRFS